MIKTIIPALIVSSGLLFASTANAEPDYTSAEVIDFLVKSADMGVARGICIGTVAECLTRTTKSTGFDLLISFELDSAELTDAAKANLEQIAKALISERLSSAKFVIEGHTDATGPEDYNLSLSQRRAQSVTNFLLKHGLSSDKITAVGVGESSPRTSDAFDPKNRRVEIRIKLN